MHKNIKNRLKESIKNWKDSITNTESKSFKEWETTFNLLETAKLLNEYMNVYSYFKKEETLKIKEEIGILNRIISKFEIYINYDLFKIINKYEVDIYTLKSALEINIEMAIITNEFIQNFKKLVHNLNKDVEYFEKIILTECNQKITSALTLENGNLKPKEWLDNYEELNKALEISTDLKYTLAYDNLKDNRTCFLDKLLTDYMDTFIKNLPINNHDFNFLLDTQYIISDFTKIEDLFEILNLNNFYNRFYIDLSFRHIPKHNFKFIDFENHVTYHNNSKSIINLLLDTYETSSELGIKNIERYFNHGFEIPFGLTEHTVSSEKGLHFSYSTYYISYNSEHLISSLSNLAFYSSAYNANASKKSKNYIEKLIKQIMNLIEIIKNNEDVFDYNLRQIKYFLMLFQLFIQTSIHTLKIKMYIKSLKSLNKQLEIENMTKIFIYFKDKLEKIIDELVTEDESLLLSRVDFEYENLQHSYTVTKEIPLCPNYKNNLGILDMVMYAMNTYVNNTYNKLYREVKYQNTVFSNNNYKIKTEGELIQQLISRAVLEYMSGTQFYIDKSRPKSEKFNILRNYMVLLLIIRKFISIPTKIRLDSPKFITLLNTLYTDDYETLYRTLNKIYAYLKIDDEELEKELKLELKEIQKETEKYLISEINN